MEQNLPIAAKKFWNTVRVVYFMLRKNISKPKLLADLNVMMKRGKIAGKTAIHNLMVHHHSSDGAATAEDRQTPPPDAYEFSCSNTPAHPTFRLPFHLNKQPSDADLFAAAMEIVGGGGGEAGSPALPGFGRTPAVRQLRITDSPFPLRPEMEVDDHVDEAAEKFIMKFYRDLKRQNTMA
ncbi:hypothetical protein PHJA_002835600 [Phtheirospermum japonicum]|uniref:Avr9/Cf-9 rapidly elicited protein 146 n=1 Tax=Phtheirospermum japonicum TaxID=374723 RepID=A0A830DJI2_9LAMI|nr:hypothetical protein PHJA_002835600 [Phtheirospermum japonicum]